MSRVTNEAALFYTVDLLLLILCISKIKLKMHLHFLQQIFILERKIK